MAGGTFFGYREMKLVVHRPPGTRPQGSISPMKLSAPFMQGVGVPGYDYRCINGDAPEDFPSTWRIIPWTCRMADWTLRGGPLEVQISYDGEVVGDTRTLRASTRTIDSFRAFRVRQLVPGFQVWYQLIAIL